MFRDVAWREDEEQQQQRWPQTAEPVTSGGSSGGGLRNDVALGPLDARTNCRRSRGRRRRTSAGVPQQRHHRMGARHRHRPHSAQQLRGSDGSSRPGALPLRRETRTTNGHHLGVTGGQPSALHTAQTRGPDELDLAGLFRRLHNGRPPPTSATHKWRGCNIHVPRPASVAVPAPDEANLGGMDEVWRLDVERAHVAATTIQCAQRRHASYRERDRRQARRRHMAATRIQAHGRGYVCRAWLRARHLAAARVQARHRSCVEQQRLDELRAANQALVPQESDPPPWSEAESEMLMWLVEREGASRWARKALQLGGRRKGENLCTQYFKVLRERAEEQAVQEQQEQAKREEIAAVAEAEKQAKREQRQQARIQEAQAAEARKWAGAAAMENKRKALWEVDATTHNGSHAYRLAAEAKREAEEAAILEVLSRTLSGHKTLFGQKMGSAKAAFAILDRDGSGQLDLLELQQGLKRLGLGLTESQIARLASTLDADGSGEISVDEFRSGLEKAIVTRRRRAAELRARLNSDLKGSRDTEYRRPWTERPKELSTLQLLQRAARRAAMLSVVPCEGCSNRAVIEQALKYACLSGSADAERRGRALRQIESAEQMAVQHDGEQAGLRYLLLLSSDARSKFRALYTVVRAAETEEARGTLLLGTGPPRLRSAMVARWLQYDSVFKVFNDSKQNSQAPGANQLDGGFDAITLRPRKAVLSGSPEKVECGVDKLSLSTNGDSSSTASDTPRWAHAVYTGGQVGYCRSAPDIAGRVADNVRALRAVHKFATAPRTSFVASLSDVYDSDTKRGVLKLSKVEREARMEQAVLSAMKACLAFERKLFGKTVHDFESFFEALDKDGSDEISMDELRRGIQRLGLGLTTEQFEWLLSTLDADGSGEISREEFAARMPH
eukprot:COSAG01_NODE_6581_length_3595_cov_68.188215_2_plen_901_part_00